MTMLALKALIAWFVILLLAMANGGLREAVLVPRLGLSAGLVVSGLLLCALVTLVAWGLVRVSRGLTVRLGLWVGLAWLALTLAFEFSFGRFVQHKAWDELWAAYTFADGNLWPLVLIVVVAAPPVVAARRRHHAA
jgi:hypothetical protein